MGTVERKKRERNKRREQIIQAAEEVIFSVGYEQAKMKDIAQKAELSKGTLYLYFDSKEELYMAIFSRGMDILRKEIGEVLTRDLSGIEMIREMGEAYIRFVREHPNYFHVLLHYETIQAQQVKDERNSAMEQICRKHVHDVFTYEKRALQIGMQDGSIDDRHDPHLLALQIWGSIRGITQLFQMSGNGVFKELMDEVEATFEQIFRNYLGLILRGVHKENVNNDQESFFM